MERNPGVELESAFDRWLSLPWTWHLLAVVILAALPLVRWGSWLVDLDEPFPDATAYYRAFDKVGNGESPLAGSDFLYPSFFAYLGHGVDGLLGRPWTVALLRAVNLLGLGAAVWCALAWLPRPPPQRLLIGALFVLLAPQVNYSIYMGNLSLAVVGATLWGLSFAWRRPALGGALLGLGIALKPIAPLIVLGLGVGRRGESNGNLRRAALTAALVAAALFFLFPYRLEFLELLATPRVGWSVTLHKALYLIGLQVSSLWISVPIAVLYLWLLWRRPLARGQFIALSTAAALAATPLVWSHTLLLALPFEVMALWVAWQRFRGGRDGFDRPNWRPVYEVALVCLAVAALQFAAGFAVLIDQPRSIQAAATSIPALAPWFLAAYLLRFAGEARAA